MNKATATTLGIIDLGSNTFHMLIVSIDHASQSFSEIFRLRQFVHLSANGLDRIGDEAMARAQTAMTLFKKHCTTYDVDQVKIIGTAIFRSSENASVLTEWVSTTLDWEIDIVTGIREAELIYKGNLFLDELPVNALIVDIGGGSVEFIVVEYNKIRHIESIQMGISHLNNTYRSGSSENYTIEERNTIKRHLSQVTSTVRDTLEKVKPNILIGTAGPFETIDLLFQNEVFKTIYTKEEILRLSDSVINSHLKAREQMPGMPVTLADLSLEAFIIMSHIFEEFQTLSTLRISPYSMKEGVIREYLD